jgi:hypothetical protein
VSDLCGAATGILLVTILVAAETLLLSVVAIFVVALLRSHAEILRRLEQLVPESQLPQPRETPVRPARALDLEGPTPDGGVRRIILSPGQDTLLAFLSTGCSTCVTLLESRRDAALPAGLRLVVVAKDVHTERLRLLRPLADGTDLVMSTPAWEVYGVPGSPYFVHVDGSTGQIVGEGSASTWPQVVSLILDAADAEAEPGNVSRRRIDDTLDAAGIDPGHPSLHPGAAAASGR